MILGSLGVLTFASPWVLAGLISLPVIWWLIRLTPPKRESIAFPPTMLLLGLRNIERTPVKSPWWLTLIRMAVAASAIFALSGPTLKPAAAAQSVMADKPILVVIDNGWAAASRWDKRTAMVEQLAGESRDRGRNLYLIATAGAQADLRPLTPDAFLERWRSVTPQAYGGDRAAVARALEKGLGSERGNLRAVWLSDGVDDEGAEILAATLRGLSGGASFEVVSDDAGAGPLGIAQIDGGGDREIRVRIYEAQGAVRSGTIIAATLQGQRLGASPFSVSAGKRYADAAIDLPLDLRNQVARLEISGEQSSGSVSLLDGRSQRRRVGVIASDDAERAQPLLSPSHYIERALTPFADVVVARTANIDRATEELLSRSPSMIALSDVGRLSGNARERLRSFVEKGGVLVRFAGPRLEQGGDDLLPAPLREGGRTLGGSMTWTSPQKPAPFETGSIFEGISIPDDVTVSQQVLADPARLQRIATVSARLGDGTPLVTMADRKAGKLIFFHVTANPDWSTLPLSGVFVEMLRKIVELAPVQLGAEPGSASVAAVGQGGENDRVLKPWRLLDGFGKLSDPGDAAQPIPQAALGTHKPSPASPAGLYGPQNATRALNVMSSGATLAALAVPDGARRGVFTEAQTMVLTPWFFLVALMLFLLDGLVTALLFGQSRPAMRKAAAAVAVGLMLSASFGSPVKAEADPALLDDATKFALLASVETRFAYILTGDAEVDRASQAGLNGLSKILSSRTAVEPGDPIGIDPARDEMVFFPFIYWPVAGQVTPLSDAVLAKVDAYMKQGGLIVFDTKNDEALASALTPAGAPTPLSQLLGKLDIPPLQRIPDDHVLTKSFYLLQSFPGRWDNGDLWVEARQTTGDGGGKRAVKSDGVSSIIVTSNDLAAAWAVDESERPMFALVPGGEEQREMSYRVGVNIVMYALTGNYKADQVHVPAILERLNH